MNIEYEIGQVWEYHTREGEENSKFTIVQMSKNEHFGYIINIAIDNLKIKYPYNEDGYLNGITHLPFNKEAIDKSIKKLVDKTYALPNYEEGYDEWKTQFDLGKAGVFTGSIKETIGVMEESFKN